MLSDCQIYSQPFEREPMSGWDNCEIFGRVTAPGMVGANIGFIIQRFIALPDSHATAEICGLHSPKILAAAWILSEAKIGLAFN